jgi:serine/threonine-protein kinase
VEFHDLLLYEARLTSRFSHGNVVQVHEVLDHQGAPVIAMEHLAGKSLYEVRTRAPELLSLQSHVHVLTQVLAGLHYSHELTDFDGTPLEVVHRDVTPQNVFLTYDGQVKVLDFGIAKLAGSLVETRVGVIKGKVRYMAPEQLQGLQVDGRTDVFACGVMLWEAITGRRLWHDMSDVEVVSALLDGELPSPRLFAPRVDAVITGICAKALAPNPADRYQSAEAFQEALERYLGSFDARVTPRELGRRLTAAFTVDREVFARAVEERLGYASLLRNSPPPRAPSVNSSPLAGGDRRSLRESAPPKPTRSNPPTSVSTPEAADRSDAMKAAAERFTVRGEARRGPLFWLLLVTAFAACSYLLTWQPTPP